VPAHFGVFLTVNTEGPERLVMRSPAVDRHFGIQTCARCAGARWICEQHPHASPPHDCNGPWVGCPVCNPHGHAAPRPRTAAADKPVIPERDGSDDALDEAIDETFPASDPPANTPQTGVTLTGINDTRE
jgi:hypothetical protein